MPTKLIVLSCLRIVLTLGLALLTFSGAITQKSAAQESQDFLWTTTAGGTNNDAGKEIAIGGVGNLYVSGDFISDQLSFAGTNLTNASISSRNAFVAKYDPAGNQIWARHFASNGDCLARSLEYGSDGHLYFCGYYTTNLSFGGTNFSSNGSFDCYLFKIKPDGALVWARHTGSAYSDIALDLADSATALHMTGFFRETIDFNGQSVTAPSGSPQKGDFYLVKYDKQGNALWARQGGGSGDDVGYGVDVDDTSNSIYACGYFQNTATFSGSNVISGGSDDLFLAKYTSNGGLSWIKRAGGSGSEKAHDVVVDSLGNVWITGYFEQTATFGATNLISAGDADIFIAKYDSAGNLLFATRVGGASGDFGESIRADAYGNIFITGRLIGNVTFGGVPFANNNPTNSTAFVAKYGSAGNLIWVKRAEGSGTSAGGGLAVDAEERIFLTGNFSGSVAFGNSSFTSNGGTDFFFTRLDELFTLNVIHGSNQAIVSWSTNAIGYELQHAPEVDTSVTWENVSTTPSIINGRHTVTNAISSSRQFYRLSKP